MSFFYSPTSALNITRCVVLDVMADALAGKNPAVLKDPFAKRLTSSCTHRAAISNRPFLRIDTPFLGAAGQPPQSHASPT
ncbi:hypothetical protein PAPYR_9505 [Paratrimastix pyriformis]|uniref:Uncharacterized protein n=1 Tax=Paratrimastix pyriformis TaxID=342808 RepID=A0ABQ8U864_9EUKA|nr:hypothetical protein PAPYR_9505 [Paratrimastix pyriformis]